MPRHTPTGETRRFDAVPNGPALAAMLASGIGGFAMGMFVLLNEAGLFVAPSLHAGAGGVSGRTTFAAAVWLSAWAVLHRRWKALDIAPAPISTVTFLLLGTGIIATFPPLWQLF